MPSRTVTSSALGAAWTHMTVAGSSRPRANDRPVAPAPGYQRSHVSRFLSYIRTLPVPGSDGSDSVAPMDTKSAARRWADTWQRCWQTGDADAIAALYAPGGRYSTGPFREPYIGPEGALAYLRPVLGEESNVEARFGA